MLLCGLAFAIVPVQDTGVALDLELRGELRLLCGINLGKLDFSLQLGGSLVPLRLEILAVTTPGSIELNHPDVFRAQDSPIKGGIGQNDNIFVCSWA